MKEVPSSSRHYGLSSAASLRVSMYKSIPKPCLGNRHHAMCKLLAKRGLEQNKMKFMVIPIIVDSTVFVNVIIHQIDAVYFTPWSPFLKSRLQGLAASLNTALFWMTFEKPCTLSYFYPIQTLML